VNPAFGVFIFIIAVLLFIIGGLSKTILGFSENDGRIVAPRGMAMHHIAWTLSIVSAAYAVWLMIKG
jgi:hypothetical protein